VGGPLALVRNGDLIELDAAARRVNLLVSDKVLAARRAELPEVLQQIPERGYLRLHHQHVMQADRGCDLDFLVGASGDVVTRESH